MTEWWTEAQSGWFGAMGGGVGALAGILGALTGLLAPRGIGRRWILGAYLAFALIGLCLLGVGITAFALHQPFHVAFLPTNMGVVLGVVAGALFFVVRRVYAHHDHRRMDAAALRHSA